MSLVYAGVCSHAPGITGRAHLVENTQRRDELYTNFAEMRRQIEASQPDALMVVPAEHFANFFMNNMPAYCVGMAQTYEGPIEDPKWLAIERTDVPGNPDLSRRLIGEMLNTVDVAYAEEWKFDHGIMVPLHFLTPNYDLPIIPVNINCQGPPLTPLHRAWAFGEAIRRACDNVPERIAVIGTGGISHWPCTPDSGKINVPWDKALLEAFFNQNKQAMLSYSDSDTYAEAGQGGFEIRTYIAIAAAAGGKKTWHYYTEELPLFAVGCTTATLEVA